MISALASAVPFFIVTHNRLSGLTNALQFLQKQDFPIQIVIADMESSYPPMISELKSIESAGEVLVWRCKNIGPRGLFFDDRFRKYVSSSGGNFFLADGDLDYSDTSSHLLTNLVAISRRFPGFRKVGAALRLDDLPSHSTLIAQKTQIILSGERRNFFETREISPELFLAPVDTTVAYYPKLTEKYYFWPALRAGGDMSVRHSPWYEDDSQLNSEQEFYIANQRKDISTMGGRQLSETKDSELLQVDRFSTIIKLVLRVFPSLGSRVLGLLIGFSNKESSLTKA